ncbi:MAG: choice-of-anchor D domain-containing protein [Desulfobacterales bacterium]|nr:choice-of-anchor D domain-containing protein [Desulfobacterales bacterium]
MSNWCDTCGEPIDASQTLCDKCRIEQSQSDESSDSVSTSTSCGGDPQIEVTPLKHDFGHCIGGKNSDVQVFTVKNAGEAPLKTGDITLAGANAGVFSISNNTAANASIAVGQSASVSVTMNSTDSGILEANLSIPSNDPANRTIRVELNGRVSSKVIVLISVDWDGHDLLASNLKPMKDLRLGGTSFENVPITHFISAGYFTKLRRKRSDWDGYGTKIRDVIKPIDECGLHVHSYHSLLKCAGVDPKGPDDWAKTPAAYSNKWGDVGHGNPFSQYDEVDVQCVLEYSKWLLENRGGLTLSKSYRSGGWVMSDDLRAALYKAGFRIDSSAVPHALVTGKGLADGVLQAQWSAITTKSTPYLLSSAGGGQLKEVPNNCALADYRTASDINSAMDAAIAYTGNGPQLVHFGFHQETVYEIELFKPSDHTKIKSAGKTDFLAKVVKSVLETWKGDSDTWDNIEFLTVEQAASRFLP